MKGYKYTVIISQYYHSRHSIIVEFNNDEFIEQAKALVRDLEGYKRRDNAKPYNYADIGYHKFGDDIKRRYNINDEGDIYFINSKFANYCKDIAVEFAMDSRREKVGFKRKQVLEDIGKHHRENHIVAIIKRHFTIA